MRLREAPCFLFFYMLRSLKPGFDERLDEAKLT